MQGLRGGSVVESLPCSAGDVGLIPGQGTKIPHATEQLSLYAATTEARTPVRESVCCNEILQDATKISN